ncbi:hypothetical protein ADIS_0649 [Lunatimonas lonarensis]|uniref:Uncharacterized protein n=1 Tax=Lunatimonas lonarensis TaxID=1232681 RepID=R7ZXF4_9BACT|nr:hypothetical protein ADIS_0649 [Lunatimonas lonarensis]
MDDVALLFGVSFIDGVSWVIANRRKAPCIRNYPASDDFYPKIT